MIVCFFNIASEFRFRGFFMKMVQKFKVQNSKFKV